MVHRYRISLSIYLRGHPFLSCGKVCSPVILISLPVDICPVLLDHVVALVLTFPLTVYPLTSSVQCSLLPTVSPAPDTFVLSENGSSFWGRRVSLWLALHLPSAWWS